MSKKSRRIVKPLIAVTGEVIIIMTRQIRLMARVCCSFHIITQSSPKNTLFQSNPDHQTKRLCEFNNEQKKIVS